MDKEWIGKTVSLDCGSVGFFQGVIAAVHLDEETITLKKAFHNGVASKMSSVTISAGQIEDLEMIDAAPPPPQSVPSGSQGKGQKQPASTVSVKKKTRTQVVDNLAKHSKSPRTADRGTPKKGMDRSSSGACGFRTPSKRMQQMIRRDDDCFGVGIDDSKMGEDFDFEKNLALFDKRLVFEEIEMESNQPDVVRLVDCNKRTAGRSEMEPKFRNDENVLVGVPAQFRTITLDKCVSQNHRGDYFTDQGLAVPAVTLSLRERLLSAAEARGMSKERLTELLARATSDLTIQLLGGTRRLNPENSHQVPRVAALCGPGRSASYGLAALRHLVSQGVRTCAYLPSFPMYPPHVNSELSLYKLCLDKNNTIVSDSKALPASVDVILLALDAHEMLEQERSQPWHRSAINWAKSCNTLVIALDPLTTDEAKAELTIKASILPDLPLWYDNNATGKLYMANLGIPPKVYEDVGICWFSSPFGAKTLIPLNQQVV